jgi:beta-glucosidase
LTYVKGADVSVGTSLWETKINTTDKSGFAEAIVAAKGADVVGLWSLGAWLQSEKEEVELNWFT